MGECGLHATLPARHTARLVGARHLPVPSSPSLAATRGALRPSTHFASIVWHLPVIQRPPVGAASTVFALPLLLGVWAADAGSWVDAWKKREVVRKQAEAGSVLGGPAAAGGDPAAAQQQKVFAKRFARAQARSYIYVADFDNDTTGMQVRRSAAHNKREDLVGSLTRE